MKPRPPLPQGPYLVVGMARSGEAASLALAHRGEEVVGVDRGTPTVTPALRSAGVQIHLEEEGPALLEHARVVIKSPGVPESAPIVAAAHARGLPVLGELELGWRLLGNEFIVVTGTNGKTTTVELIGQIHREAELGVVVAGNVGTALSGLAGKIDAQATVVCEASSFQLQDTVALAPEAAVLLNLAPDHLDRHGTFEAYVEAKLEVFKRQGPEDLAIVPLALRLQLGSRLAGRARGVWFGSGPDALLEERDGALWWEERALLAVEEVRLRGRHNLQNAMAAAAVCLARGIDPEAVCAGLRRFAGVPHRLEEVARREGVLYVNDSKATNVASTLVALDAFADAPIHLILGGQAKGQEFGALRAPVCSGCAAVYLIGQDAPTIAAALRDCGVPLHECGELERALAGAGSAAAPGETVLLSPGCASFDQFKDFEERGERFRALVEHSEGFRPRASK